MKTIEKIMKEKDESITLQHQNKDIEELRSSLAQLETEHNKVKKDFNSISYFLSLISKHSVGDLDGLTDEVIKHEDFNKWLEKTKSILEKLHLKHTDELNISEKEYIKTEKAKLTYESKRLEKQLRYLDEIIAKTKVLLQDLDEGYCVDLTNGHDLASVGEKLVEKFGNTITSVTYRDGRKKIIDFLERTFSIDKIKSKKLVDLLEDCSLVDFKTDISKINTGPFFAYDDAGSDFESLVGTWTINS